MITAHLEIGNSTFPTACDFRLIDAKIPASNIADSNDHEMDDSK
jgi:hypothetical protein